MTVSKGSKMQISINTSGEITILELVGKLDTQTSPEAQARLDELIEQGGRKILVHLGQLDYISSAGLRVLLAASKQLKPQGGEIRICSLNDVVREVFDISGFVTIFRVFGSEAEALDGF